MEKFVEEPTREALTSLKKNELVDVAKHYKIEVVESARKAEIKKLILDYLIKEDLIEEGEASGDAANALELKRLEYQERERERENQIRIKELELKEKELSTQLKLRELEAGPKEASGPPRTDKSADFDISKQIRFVPVFQETEVDKYFTHFEKIAKSLAWPEEVWTLLLQSVLVGKAREVYSTLTVEQCADYAVVRQAVLKAYELVPEAYRQKFRNSIKQDSQTYLEFARQKEALFDRWCAAKTVEKDFTKLRQLVLVEEFKKCLHSDVKMYLDEQKADEYFLTHKRSFEKDEVKGASHLGNKQPDRSFPPNRSTSRAGGQGRGEGRDQRGRVPGGPICFYCKRKGHVMSECWSLERKERNKTKSDLIVQKAELAPTVNKSPQSNVSEYQPFISQGLVSLVGEENKAKPICVLRDTGTSQSLILEGILPLSDQSYTSNNVLIQGVGLGVISVPLHIVNLHTSLVSGPAMVGVRPTLPVQGVSFILGNDLAGERVMAEPCVFHKPQISEDSGDSDMQIPGIFPSCAVT